MAFVETPERLCFRSADAKTPGASSGIACGIGSGRRLARTWRSLALSFFCYQGQYGWRCGLVVAAGMPKAACGAQRETGRCEEAFDFAFVTKMEDVVGPRGVQGGGEKGSPAWPRAIAAC